jgi:hypothetical protein
MMILTTGRLGGERFLHLFLKSVMDLFLMLHGFLTQICGRCVG